LASIYLRRKELAAAMQYYADDIGAIGTRKLHAREYAAANLDWKKNSQDLPDIIEIVRRAGKPDPELKKARCVTKARCTLIRKF